MKSLLREHADRQANLVMLKLTLYIFFAIIERLMLLPAVPVYIHSCSSPNNLVIDTAFTLSSLIQRQIKQSSKIIVTLFGARLQM